MNIEQEIQDHLKNIIDLRAPSGLFLASAQGVSTGYDKAWLRDNFYAVLAFEATGDWNIVMQTWTAIMHIFEKHKEKISWAAQNKPHESWQYIHARYHPESFDEFWEEWGNKQNDAVGAVIFKLADIELQGKGIIKTDGDREMLQALVDYLNSVEYWHDPDNGIWEEYEEVHASSVGAVVAGLKKLSQLDIVNIPEGLIEKGEESLSSLMPRESTTKFCDLALLSLIYPYDVIERETAEKIIENLHYQFDRRSGIIRYKHDYYYNKNEDGYSEEAEWVMGFPWLSIIYSRWGDKERARNYIYKTKKLEADGNKLPELYYSNSDQPNENTPLGWAESLYIVALKEYAERFGETEI
ncbi:MAG: glycoside hydrolase family 15 protein [Patescibacteria group bacterium]